jgi:hypothetical protein
MVICTEGYGKVGKYKIITYRKSHLHIEKSIEILNKCTEGYGRLENIKL